MKISKDKICAIIVTYNSDLLILENVIKSINSEIKIILCDNTDNSKISSEIQKFSTKFELIYISMNGNYGIAYAQNKGINEAWSLGFQAVLLLDDDSIPDRQMLSKIIHAFINLKNDLAVVSARTITENGIDVSNQKRSNKEIDFCRDLTSSGSLITKYIFNHVGPFKEDLFIDCVDFEWGWRAISRNINLYLVNDAILRHRLGVDRKFFINIPSPIRHYYQYRNIIKLIFHNNTPYSWRLSQFFKLFIKLFFILTIMPDRKNRLLFALKGIYHALQSRSGRLI